MDGNGGKKLVYTIPEACEMLSLSRAAIYRLIDRREIATVKVGRSRRVTLRQLDEFVRRMEGQAPPSISPLSGRREGNP